MTTFSDDFNRADGAPGANWVPVSGPWAIVSNQLSPGASGATIVIRAATAMATNDNSAQITIAATTPVSQGVFCRGDATLANGYLLRNDGTTWALFKVVAGTFTSIGTFAAAAVAGDVAKVQAVGSTITGTINGTVRISLTDTAVTSGTSVGLRSMSTSGLRYDDFVSGDVVTGTTATAGLAAAAAAALQPVAGPAALPTAAPVAGTAYGPQSATAASAGRATVTGAALQSAATVAARPGTAAAVAVAYPATATGSSSTTATAGLAAVTAAGYAPLSGTAALSGTATAAGTALAPRTAIVVTAGRAPVAGTAYGVRNLRPPSTDVTRISGREPAASVGGREPAGSVSGREPGTQV